MFWSIPRGFFWQIVFSSNDIIQIPNVSQICTERYMYNFGSWNKSTVVFFSGIQQNHFRVFLMGAELWEYLKTKMLSVMLLFSLFPNSTVLANQRLICALTAQVAKKFRPTKSPEIPYHTQSERMEVAINALILYELQQRVCVR